MKILEYEVEFIFVVVIAGTIAELLITLIQSTSPVCFKIILFIKPCDIFKLLKIFVFIPFASIPDVIYCVFSFNVKISAVFAETVVVSVATVAFVAIKPALTTPIETPNAAVVVPNVVFTVVI